MKLRFPMVQKWNPQHLKLPASLSFLASQFMLLSNSCVLESHFGKLRWLISHIFPLSKKLLGSHCLYWGPRMYPPSTHSSNTKASWKCVGVSNQAKSTYFYTHILKLRNCHLKEMNNNINQISKCDWTTLSWPRLRGLKKACVFYGSCS